MTVKQPRSGVIGLKGDDNVGIGLRHDDVAPGWVDAGEGFVLRASGLDVVGGERFVGLVDDSEVVTV